MKENKYGKEKRGITIAKRGMAAALVIILICMVSSCGKKSDDTEALGKVVAGLGDDELFAIVEAGAKHSILLTSDQTYDDENGNQASILCEVYYEEEDGEAKHLGTLESLGTAYPIAYDKSGLYTAGGHEVKRYEIDSLVYWYWQKECMRSMMRMGMLHIPERQEWEWRLLRRRNL